MSERFSSYHQFEAFCADLFRGLGLEVTEQSIIPREARFGADFFIRANTFSIPAEVKVFGSRRFGSRFLFDAAFQLSLIVQASASPIGILICETPLEKSQIDQLEKEFQTVKVFDANALIYLAAVSDSLTRQLVDILGNISPFFETSNVVPRDVSQTLELFGISVRRPDPVIRSPRDFCKELREINPGRTESGKFEKVCIEALKFLFDANLSAWMIQPRTDTGMSRNDLVCRNPGLTDFWSVLRGSFFSLYVIFEFKNYRDEIPQGQIFSTERYLYRAAQRNTAIIISRKGLSQNAKSACKGALREHGKLMLGLSIDDICLMIEQKKDGNEPSVYLSGILDDLLIHIER